MKQLKNSVCKICKKTELTFATNKIYCSECAKDTRIGKVYDGVSVGTVGAIAELEVSQDLMKKGFDVYRALSPQSKSDVVAIKKDKILILEIRSGYKSRCNTIYYSKNGIRSPQLVVYIHRTGEIIYKPKLE